jgi:hypothetical protein
MSDSTPLTSFRVRPRFRVRVAEEAERARARVLEALADLPEGLEVRAFPGLLGLHIADARRKTWSPRLLLHFEPQRDGGTVIEGVYGPETEIWSVFVYGYFFTGMLGMFSAILGGAQFFIGAHPWALWVTVAMAVLAAALYVAAQFGQKLGAWQTFQLHQAWQGAAARVGVLTEA